MIQQLVEHRKNGPVPVTCMPDATTGYEQAMARQTGIEHVVAFGFARHALVAALAAAGLGAGDEVILSPLTCKVVPLALLSLGVKPVYADISGTTLNLDPGKVEPRISTLTRAIVFQHTYGNSGGIDLVAEIADRHGLFLLEDCAQCLPLDEDGYSPGHHGSCAIFSNNPGKPLPVGSGGIAITGNASLAEKIMTIRDKLPLRTRTAEFRLYVEESLQRYLLHPCSYWALFDLKRSMDANYSVRTLSDEIASEIDQTAYRPSRRQMQLGSEKMHTIIDVARHRTRCCDSYNRSFDSTSEMTAPFSSVNIPLLYYPVLADNKAELLQQARKERVEIIPWPVKTPIYPVEDLPALEIYGYEQNRYPVAESVAQRVIGLPTHKKVTSAVLEKIAGFINQGRPD